MDKSKLGIRYTCFECGTRFYNLNRPESVCPECGADQANAPVVDLKASLTGKGARRRRRDEAKEDKEDIPTVSDDEDLDDLGDDDDDDDIFGDSDDDDSDDEDED